MSQTITTLMLGQTAFAGNNTTVISDHFPAAGYYLSKKNLQTLAWKLTSVSGYVSFQATLSEVPTDGDWFEVHSIDADGLTQISYQNVTGNFVWIRVVISNFSAGVIQHIKVSY
jgi:hypothetical protein